MTKTPRLKDALTRGEFVLAPGVFEMFSAKIADRIGFRALYMTGYGVSASYLGLADAGLVTYRDMVERARTIAEGVSTPLIADADTGFGGLLNVRQTVRGYEAAGVQAIQIEDQETPKKCGHTPNRRVIPKADMCRKIEVAIDARARPDTLIIARTDARTGLGLDEAIARGKAYARAGADIVFVEAPESEEEFERIGGEIDAWLVANMVPTGKSPVVPADRLKAYGFNLAIYPSAGMAVVCAALEANYRYLKEHSSTEGSPVAAYTMAELHELVGFDDVWAFEKRYAET
ncbi:MAG TPA: isocitrate lyase/PEP mutase family protein [Microvirga sp.]|nr:isocitrate lyase/PEP mutase family protein [Microvirga sp.]